MYLPLVQLPGARWMCCSYAMYVNVKDIQMSKKNLHILSAFNPFSYPQKEYKKFLEWKVSNLKLAWEEEVKVFLKLWVQLSIVKFAIYY